MSSTFALPRTTSSSTNPYAAANPYSGNFSSAYGRGTAAGSSGGAYGGGGSAGARATRVARRALKFSSMDFEVAAWEMYSLMVAPKSVFRRLWYQRQTQSGNGLGTGAHATTTDPAFTYLQLATLFVAAIVWPFWTHWSVAVVAQTAFFFCIVHYLLCTLTLATVMWLVLPRLLGPRGLLARRGFGGRRSRGLFGSQLGGGSSGGEELEWSYCFDVSTRTFTPLLIYLYLFQFLLFPFFVSRLPLSRFLSNSLYALAYTHALYVQFCGYSNFSFDTSSGASGLASANLVTAAPDTGVPLASSSGARTPGVAVLLSPLALVFTFWLVSVVAGWSASAHLAPVLWCAVGGPGVNAPAPTVPPDTPDTPADAAPPGGAPADGGDGGTAAAAIAAAAIVRRAPS